ncbi:MAG: hypothetical protein IKE36_12030 [Solobacterium sp.]|nr:hypothetical protein [Solobacterium sp.]
MKKLIQIFWYSFLFSLLFPYRVYAYIDPSVTTYAIQAIAGVIIGLSAFINIYWRKIARKLKLDQSTAEYESDVLKFEDPQNEQVILASEKDSVTLQNKRRTQIIFDVILALGVSFALIYLLFVYGPLEIYAHNISEFWFDIYVMMTSIVPVFFLLWFLITGILLLVRRYSQRWFMILSMVVFGTFLVFYIQGNFFVSNLPSMDGTTIIWSEYTKDMIISVCLVILVIAVLCLGDYFIRERMRGMMSLISVLISAVLVITTVSLAFSTNILNRKLHYIITDQENMTLSQDKNFLILLLDAVDSRMVYEQYTKDPENYEEAFEDFMYYPDTAGAYSFTHEAVPFIMNGVWYENDQDFHDLQLTEMANSPLFRTLEQDHWSIDYYDHDLLYITDEDTLTRYRNAVPFASKFKSIWAYTAKQFNLTMYKYAPYFLKPLTDYDLDSFIDLYDVPEGTVLNSFEYSNASLYHQLLDEGFKAQEPGKSFKYYHLDGAHVPFQYDLDLNIIPKGSGNYDDSVRISMKVAEAFVQALKQTDVYDSSVVIIIADHGYPYQNEGPTGRGNPLLMVKGFDEHHEFTVSEAPVSFEDLQDLYQRLLEGYTGDQQFTWKAGDVRKRRYLGYVYNNKMTEYMIEGKASDLESYHPTGNVYILED